MPVINLYDNLNGTKSEGGTWTYTGAASPHPAPPATWDGDIDTTGFGYDDYQYTYTVNGAGGCSIDSVLDISLLQGTIPLGESCDKAITPDNPTINPGETNIQSGTFLGGCPGTLAPTLSGIALPASWPVDTEADLWFYYIVSSAFNDGSGIPRAINVTVSGNGGPDPISNFSVAAYTRLQLENCGDLDLIGDALATDTAFMTLSSADVPGRIAIIRVGIGPGGAGNFDITITSQPI